MGLSEATAHYSDYDFNLIKVRINMVLTRLLSKHGKVLFTTRTSKSFEMLSYTFFCLLYPSAKVKLFRFNSQNIRQGVFFLNWLALLA